MIFEAARKGTLTLNDPRLGRAAAQFPENAIIARVVLGLTNEAKKPVTPALIQAIKAEYSHFSPGCGVFPRPSADGLRFYFKLLSAELAKAK